MKSPLNEEVEDPDSERGPKGCLGVRDHRALDFGLLYRPILAHLTGTLRDRGLPISVCTETSNTNRISQRTCSNDFPRLVTVGDDILIQRSS